MSNPPIILDDGIDRMSDFISQARHKPGFALPAYFYQSSLVYQNELSAIFLKSWIYAGHVSELPNPGDFQQVEFGSDSFIVVRDKQGELHALANVCRHRGARVCEEKAGNCKTFVCPYHCWTYNMDGSLRAARHMEALEGFDRADYGLKKVKLCEFEGLIFINCNPDAPDFSGPLANIRPQLAGYNLPQAKIALKRTYSFDSNWKFCLENYLECYHCATAHPAYAKLHTFEDRACNVQEQLDALWARSEKVTGIEGLIKEHRRIFNNAEAFGACISAHRYGLYEGNQTGSMDGKPVAPLMGSFEDFDGGAGDFQIGPLTYMLNYPDHCVLYRFLPRGLHETEMELVWFVRGDAEEGKDYKLDRLTDLWHRTTLEDAYIISRNAEGVHSKLFEPGPFHPEFESILQQFNAWYLAALADIPD